MRGAGRCETIKEGARQSANSGPWIEQAIGLQVQSENSDAINRATPAGVINWPSSAFRVWLIRGET